MNVTREILKQVKSEESVLAVYHEIREEGDWIAFFHAFAYDEDYKVARNALWALTKTTDEEISQLQPILREIVMHAMTTPNSSVRRLTLNAVERLQIKEDDLQTEFLDFCLEHMMDVEEFPGIQSLCLKLAYRMCSFYPELMDELMRTLEGMEISYYKPAIKCLRNKILLGRF